MDTVDRIRSFNRFYTARLGLLNRQFLGSDLGLSEMRILHDLNVPDPPTARDLARETGIDEAQVSRSLARFEKLGWISRRVSETDARRRDLALTEVGHAVLSDLKRRSRKAIAAMLAPLPDGGQRALADALDRARLLLDDQPRPPPRLRNLEPGDAGWIVSRHAEVYARDEGYDSSFEALVAEIVAGFLRNHDPGRERGWIAARGDRRVGSIFCVRETDQAAKLRLFLLEPDERGSSLAQQMIETCIGFARDRGYARMRLWTHESHHAAGRVYARNGFRLVQSSPTREFGCDVVDQTWERDL